MIKANPQKSDTNLFPKGQTRISAAKTQLGPPLANNYKAAFVLALFLMATHTQCKKPAHQEGPSTWKSTKIYYHALRQLEKNGVLRCDPYRNDPQCQQGGALSGHKELPAGKIGVLFETRHAYDPKTGEIVEWEERPNGEASSRQLKTAAIYLGRQENRLTIPQYVCFFRFASQGGQLVQPSSPAGQTSIPHVEEGASTRDGAEESDEKIVEKMAAGLGQCTPPPQTWFLWEYEPALRATLLKLYPEFSTQQVLNGCYKKDDDKNGTKFITIFWESLPCN